MNPFRVSRNWVYFCEQPPSESGHESAKELMELHDATTKDFILIPPGKAYLVAELVDCSGLYTPERGMDREERARALQAVNVIRRGRAWLRAVAQSCHHGAPQEHKNSTPKAT